MFEKVSVVVCCTAFFIKVSPEWIMLASSHCNEKAKTYCVNLSAPFIREVPPFKEVLMKTMPNIDVLFGYETEARELVSSSFVFVPVLVPTPAPKTRSNTTNDIELIRVFLLVVNFSSTCPACPKILTTSPNKRTINGKTISTRHHRNMTAAVTLEEVERRTLVPRDMIRLVHKGKMISEKKSMKENNIKAKETIEKSLRLLGGMELNDQMDTLETEEDREKKRKLDEGKEGKMTKPNEDMAYLKRDIMEALRRSDENMDSYSRKTDEKMECYSRKTDEK